MRPKSLTKKQKEKIQFIFFNSNNNTAPAIAKEIGCTETQVSYVIDKFLSKKQGRNKSH